MNKIYLVPFLCISALLLLVSDVAVAQETVNDMTFTTLRIGGSGRTWKTDDVRVEHNESSGTLTVTGYYPSGDPDGPNPTQEMTLRFRDYSGDGNYSFNGGNAEWEDRNSGTGICKYLHGDGGNIKAEIDSTTLLGSFIPVLTGDFSFRCESAPRVGDAFETDITGTFKVAVGYQVTAPERNIVVEPGDDLKIEWQTIASGNVDIYYALEDPATDPEKYVIKKGVSADLGSYTWEIADTMSPQAWIVLVNPSFPDHLSKSEVFKIRGPQFAKIAYDAEGSCPECPYYLTFTPKTHGWSVENGNPATFVPSRRSDSWRFDYGSATDPFTGSPYTSVFNQRPISAKTNRYPEWPNFVPAFGEEVFYGTTAGGSATPLDRQARVWSYHAEPYGGSCYALAALAGMAFIDPEGTLARYPELGSLSNAKRLNTATIDNSLADVISKIFALQSGAFETGRRSNATNRGPNEMIRRLKEFFAEDDAGAQMSGSNVLCVEDYGGDGGAHAVTAYKIVEDEDAGTTRIYVYDNNYPNDENKFVNVDVNANTWFYDAWGWGGAGGIWLAMPFDKFDETPILYPYDNQNNRIMLVRPGMAVSAQGESGESFAYTSADGFSTTDEEASPLFRMQGPGPPVSYTFPSDYHSFGLTAETGEGVSTMLIGEDHFVSFWSDMAEGDESRITWETGRVTIFNPQSGPQTINVDALFEEAGIGRTLGVGELLLQGGDSVLIQISDEEETVEVTNFGAETRYEVVVRQTGAEGHLEGGYTPVDIRKGETHLIQPRWDSLAADLPIYISDGAGSSDSLLLDNLLMSVAVDSRHALSSLSVQNPMTNTSHLNLILQNGADVSVKVVDLVGSDLGVLFEGYLPAGEHVVPISMEDLDAGSYLLSLVIDGRRAETLMIIKAE